MFVLFVLFRQHFVVIFYENRTAQFAQFYKIVLYTFKFLVHTLWSKTHYFILPMVQIIIIIIIIGEKKVLNNKKNNNHHHHHNHHHHKFLTCVSLTAHVIAIGWTSVRPSIHHTLVLCRNGSTYRQTVFTAW